MALRQKVAAALNEHDAYLAGGKDAGGGPGIAKLGQRASGLDTGWTAAGDEHRGVPCACVVEHRDQPVPRKDCVASRVQRHAVFGRARHSEVVVRHTRGQDQVVVGQHRAVIKDDLIVGNLSQAAALERGRLPLAKAAARVRPTSPSPQPAGAT